MLPLQHTRAPVTGVALVLVACVLAYASAGTNLRTNDHVAGDVDVVHFVSMNHLDVGFDGIDPVPGYAYNVVNKYFDIYFPAAIKTSQRLRSEGRVERLVYTTHSWLVSMYLSCPEGMNFHCPSKTAVADFKDAIHRGDVTWHAFPFNSEPEAMDASLFEYGFELSHDLDDVFNKTHATVMSQKDVPGLTRSALPLMLKNGVIGVSVGVNGFSMPPAVPSAFVWRDEASKSDVLATWTPGGYAGDIVVKGLRHAMSVRCRSDNQGPPGYQEVLDDYAELKKTYPNAKVIASTFDAFFEQLKTVQPQLPVVTGEIGDTWVHGVASDPKKNQVYRMLMRARTRCLEVEMCDRTDLQFRNFSRILLKGTEHTWGGDVKTFLDASHSPLYYQWSNEQFAKVEHAPAYKALVGTWVEQRDLALKDAVAALDPSHPLMKFIMEGTSEITRVAEGIADSLQQDGFEHVSNVGDVVHCGDFDIAFDSVTGGVSHLSDTRKGVNWASGRKFASLVYQSFTEEDQVAFIEQYGMCDVHTDCPWALFDFGKDNLTEMAHPRSQTVGTHLISLFTKKHRTATQFVAEVVLDNIKDLHTNYGAPAVAFLKFTVHHSREQGIELDMVWKDKTRTRIPEALWLQFQPTPSGPNADVLLSKLGRVVSSLDVVKNGSQHIHAVDDGGVVVVKDSHSGPSMTIQTFDAPVLSVGLPSPFPTPVTKPVVDDGVSICLYNNIWGTNYIMWYPFQDGDKDALFRFRLSFSD